LGDQFEDIVMDYVDATLIRLADSASRGALFDNTALEQLLEAAYDTDALGVEGPYRAVFEELRLGFAVSRVASVDGVWCPVGSNERVEAQFKLSGLSEAGLIRVDALWRGQIVARASPATSRITDVAVEWSEPVEAVHPGRVQVALSEPPGGAATAMPLPIVAALLIRDAGFSVAQLLMESKMVREQLESAWVEKATPSEIKPRWSVLVVWMVPMGVFDDADWPGNTPDERRGLAGQWLAREGIGLVAVASA
jgi:hypothetical protein